MGPLASQAQERVRRVGVLTNLRSGDEAPQRLTVSVQELGRLVWTTGRNLQIDYGWSEADAGDRLRKAELIALPVELVPCSQRAIEVRNINEYLFVKVTSAVLLAFSAGNASVAYRVAAMSVGSSKRNTLILRSPKSSSTRTRGSRALTLLSSSPARVVDTTSAPNGAW
jgi:hypothetical protein